MFRITFIGVAGVLYLGFMSGAAAAQDVNSTPAPRFGSAPVEPRPNTPAAADLPATPVVFEPFLIPKTFNPFPEGLTTTLPKARPRILPVLYVSFVGLEAYDGYSTITGTAGGATETNPLLGRFTDNSYAIWAVKGGVSVALIYAAEQLWRRHHRGEAVAVMIISNGLMAGAAARNGWIKRAQ